jgi:hypothetical protein
MVREKLFNFQTKVETGKDLFLLFEDLNFFNPSNFLSTENILKTPEFYLNIESKVVFFNFFDTNLCFYKTNTFTVDNVNPFFDHLSFNDFFYLKDVNATNF